MIEIIILIRIINSKQILQGLNPNKFHKFMVKKMIQIIKMIFIRYNLKIWNNLKKKNKMKMYKLLNSKIIAMFIR
jgi:hypothetical protein